MSESALHFLHGQASGEQTNIEALNVDGEAIDAFSVNPRPALLPCE